jgi:hypothetical protein
LIFLAIERAKKGYPQQVARFVRRAGAPTHREAGEPETPPG